MRASLLILAEYSELLTCTNLLIHRTESFKGRIVRSSKLSLDAPEMERMKGLCHRLNKYQDSDLKMAEVSAVDEPGMTLYSMNVSDFPRGVKSRSRRLISIVDNTPRGAPKPRA